MHKVVKSDVKIMCHTLIINGGVNGAVPRIVGTSVNKIES
jgi:hypothetical protein